ncbi:MAG: M3 family metallopeptidase [Bacteroidales bacterium]|nr:M3 family metallopeptidase [Bacteroidales bacterium]
MKKSLLIASVAAVCLLGGCKDKKNMDNPFFAQWGTPYEIPDFGKIKPEHYMPAFEEGMKQQKEEIAAILNNTEAPTFENTIEALEYSGSLLQEVEGVFFNLCSSNNSEEMEAIQEEVAPLLAKHGDDISLNADLFARIKAVYDQKDQLNLEPEQARLLEETYKGFVRGGALVPADKQDRFREINEKLATLEPKFANNVLKATNAYQLTLTKEQLGGLTEGQIQAAQEAAGEEGKYVITLHNPSLMPFLTNSSDRKLREEIWNVYSSRCTSGEFDNTAIIDQIVNLRLEKANILGFNTWSDYVLDDCIAKTPKAVYDLLGQMWTPALKKAKAECAEYQKMLVADEGKDAKLMPWDWRYYSERLRQERYAIDDTVSYFFSLDNVRQGAFDVATKLYGITFRENKDLPTYDAEATAYEVVENDEVIAVLYMDFHPRASKRSGAWMTEFRGQYVDQQGNNHIPLISVVCNFTKPTADKPSLLDFDEAETLFHEFGHALHGMLSKCHYRSLAGTNVPRDFVELPSQIMENWCRNAQCMKEYARHYKTGEVIPDALIKKIMAAQTYGQGFVNTELLAASLLDMDYHTIAEPTKIVLPDFEDKAMAKIGLISEIISRYKSTYFTHIFDTGYSSGYYSYTWTAVLDADAFEAFRESGDIYNPELAKKFRKVISSGNTTDLMTLYREFRGKDPDIKPLLRNRGLL